MRQSKRQPASFQLSLVGAPTQAIDSCNRLHMGVAQEGMRPPTARAESAGRLCVAKAEARGKLPPSNMPIFRNSSLAKILQIRFCEYLVVKLLRGYAAYLHLGLVPFFEFRR